MAQYLYFKWLQVSHSRPYLRILLHKMTYLYIQIFLLKYISKITHILFEKPHLLRKTIQFCNNSSCFFLHVLINCSCNTEADNLFRAINENCIEGPCGFWVVHYGLHLFQPNFHLPIYILMTESAHSHMLLGFWLRCCMIAYLKQVFIWVQWYRIDWVLSFG